MSVLNPTADSYFAISPVIIPFFGNSYGDEFLNDIYIRIVEGIGRYFVFTN